jgi:lipopolysaccharide export system permease protein
MGIIDKYILKKYFGTLGFMLLLLSIVVIVIDVQSKAPRIEENGYSVGFFLTHFYPFWMFYLMITFMSILVFISIIFFSSKLANNTEVVAIISSGASFHRFARPYFIAAFITAGIALSVNHFVLPWANVAKNKYIIYTYNAENRRKLTDNTSIATQLTANEMIFIHSYNRMSKRGSGYLYQKFDNNKKLVQQISASEVSWNDKKKMFELNNFQERLHQSAESKDQLISGQQRFQDFKYDPDELFPNELLGENKTTPELIKFIKNEQAKGNANLNIYLAELAQRSSMPISVIILTMLALSLSTEKRRGGLGLNLAIGIAVAFVFIFSFEALKVAVQSNSLSPAMAMWMPNMVFAPLAIYLYFKRANM